MTQETILLTQEGMENLRAELVELEHTEMPSLLRRLAEARAHGDLSENAEYHAVKERKAHAVARIGELQDVLNHADVFEPDEESSGGKCTFGCTVKICVQQEGKEDTRRKFKLVSPYEADSTTGRLSITSPLGSKLLGRVAGDIVEVDAPAGQIIYEIISISF